MKVKMTKVLSLVLVIVMLFVIPTFAAAQPDEYALYTANKDTQALRGAATFWDIASLGQYAASFVGVKEFVNTRSYFKPNSSGRLSVKVVSSWKYHEDSSFNPGITIQIKSQSNNSVVKSYSFGSCVGTNKYSFTGLGSNTEYYVTVKMRSTESSGKNTISGQIFVQHTDY